MRDGRKVSEYQQIYVMKLLEAFNQNHLSAFNQAYNLDIDPIDEHKFIAFVGIGQKSRLHLEKFIHQHVMLSLHQTSHRLRETHKKADEAEKKRIEDWFERMNQLCLSGDAPLCKLTNCVASLII